GLFADGTSNYGGSWNGVNGSVTGLFYGDPGQLVAQLIGVGTLLGFVFSLSYVSGWIIDIIIGQRVPAADEVKGLDIPAMGALLQYRICAGLPGSSCVSGNCSCSDEQYLSRDRSP